VASLSVKHDRPCGARGVEHRVLASCGYALWSKMGGMPWRWLSCRDGPVGEGVICRVWGAWGRDWCRWSRLCAGVAFACTGRAGLLRGLGMVRQYQAVLGV
jgi:hypothetical protein